MNINEFYTKNGLAGKRKYEKFLELAWHETANPTARADITSYYEAEKITDRMIGTKLAYDVLKSTDKILKYL
jgi:hypothetical protein